ncbi:MAG: TetR/AcrR family transcriptional regulator [Conexibacter sp.]|nr:TetR/AcrR family transcriptional regulator [Conexibacter sp.]
MATASQPGRNGRHRSPQTVAPHSRGRDREVLDAAAAVFARRGYSASTVQDVADALGILKGSLYYYIDTKEDLLFCLLEEVHEAAEILHAEVAAAEQLSPLGQLLLYVRLQVTWNTANLVKISVYYNDLRQLSSPRLSDLRRRSKAHEQFIVDLIDAGQRRGEIIDDVPPTLLSHQVLAVVIWPYHWFRPRGPLPAGDLVAACAEFVRRGLARSPAP